MKTIFFMLLFVVASIFSLAGRGNAEEQLVLYTSMKESLIVRLQEAFLQLHPGIDFEFHSTGAGKLMAEIEAERKDGGIEADILWTSELPDFLRMRDEKLLLNYVSPEFPHLLNPFGELYDGSFTAARLGTIGIVYNSNFLKGKPKPEQWSDLTKSEYQNAFVIADPSSSGTAYMSVLLLIDYFGWDFFEALGRNGTQFSEGSSAVIDDTATELFVACLGVDYAAFDKIQRGASLGISYPKEMLVLPSPIAIFKDSPNPAAAKKFVDFLLSQQGQTILATEGTLPVRTDVSIPSKYHLPSPEEALTRAIPFDPAILKFDKQEVVARLKEIIKVQDEE